MGVETDTRAAIEALILTAGYPVAFENVDFDPPSAIWLDVQLFRTGTDRLTIGGAHRRVGFLQVAVMAPQGFGTGAADTVAEEIQALFPTDLKLGPTRVTRLPEIAGGYPDGAFWRVPVSIYWENLSA